MPLMKVCSNIFLHNMAIPFIDHVISELETRFNPLSATSSMLLGLVPSVHSSQEVDIAEAVEVYKDDLPTPELIDEELKGWRFKWEDKSPQAQSSSCVQAINKCDVQQFQHFTTAKPGMHIASNLM